MGVHGGQVAVTDSVMPIRAYRSSDLAVLYAINQASTPGVGSEADAAGLARWIALSTCLVATDDDDGPVGFITLIPLGTSAYLSANLRWFEAWQDQMGGDLIYVDRIAVAASARGQQIGAGLYAAAFAASVGRSGMACEVNLAPPNPGSLRFHAGQGFEHVGERSFDGGKKAVAYLIRPL
ncbi:MAG: GNAT family N-acetyltransferase [Pseudomonadota bacterium]